MFGTRKFDEEIEGRSASDQLELCAPQTYFIALVLTDDEQSAADLTRDNFDHLLTSNSTFSEWFTRWARRLTIKACVHAKTSELRSELFSSESWEKAAASLAKHPVQGRGYVSPESIEGAVRALPLLARFVFVSRVLERYSDAKHFFFLPTTCTTSSRLSATDRS
jgi:hypothetical protein